MELRVWFSLRAWRICAGTWWMIYNLNPDKQVWKLHDGENGKYGTHKLVVIKKWGKGQKKLCKSRMNCVMVI